MRTDKIITEIVNVVNIITQIASITDITVIQKRPNLSGYIDAVLTHGQDNRD